MAFLKKLKAKILYIYMYMVHYIYKFSGGVLKVWTIANIRYTVLSILTPRWSIHILTRPSQSGAERLLRYTLQSIGDNVHALIWLVQRGLGVS